MQGTFAVPWGAPRLVRAVTLICCPQIVEGRRTVKGKVEVKMRMRKPAVSDQVEQIKEKWLVIDKL